MKGRAGEKWEVPYLPLNPNEIGMKYQPIVINSQSGKNGVAFILKENYGFKIPKQLEKEIGKIVQDSCDKSGKSITPEEIKVLFKEEFCKTSGTVELLNFHQVLLAQDSGVKAQMSVKISKREFQIEGVGNGPIDAAISALREIGQNIEIKSFEEHSLTEGSKSSAVAYIECEKDGVTKYGVGIHESTERAAILGLIAAINRF